MVHPREPGNLKREQENLMRGLVHALRGHYSLAITFWGFFIGGWVSLLFAFVVLVSALLHTRIAWMLPYFAVIYYGYPVLAAIAVWNAARSSSANVVFRMAARFVAVFFAVILLYQAALAPGVEAMFVGPPATHQP